MGWCTSIMKSLTETNKHKALLSLKSNNIFILLLQQIHKRKSVNHFTVVLNLIDMYLNINELLSYLDRSADKSKPPASDMMSPSNIVFV